MPFWSRRRSNESDARTRTHSESFRETADTTGIRCARLAASSTSARENQTATLRPFEQHRSGNHSLHTAMERRNKFIGVFWFEAPSPPTLHRGPRGFRFATTSLMRPVFVEALPKAPPSL